MTAPLRLFFIGGLTAYRGLINWLSPWIFFPTLILQPIFQILLFVFIGRSAGVQSDEFRKAYYKETVTKVRPRLVIPTALARHR